MEILRKGKPPKERFWVGVCGSCKSLFRAQEKELGKIEHGDYRSDNEAWSRADCTVCGKKAGIVLHLENSDSAQRDIAEMLREKEAQLSR